MNDQTKSRNIWWVLGLIGLVIVGVVAIAYLVSALFGSGGGAAEGPEAELPTPAPGTPSATALEAIHVRSGPGTLYPSYGVAPKGASAEVIGVSSSGQWWVVKMPSEIAPGGQFQSFQLRPSRPVLNPHRHPLERQRLPHWRPLIFAAGQARNIPPTGLLQKGPKGKSSASARTANGG
jgi:hypothetical protein